MPVYFLVRSRLFLGAVQLQADTLDTLGRAVIPFLDIMQNQANSLLAPASYRMDRHERGVYHLI